MEKAVGNRGISAPLVFFLIVVYCAISILLRRRGNAQLISKEL